MTFDRDDIALLRQIIREEVRSANSQDLQLQAEFLVTLPIEERKRRAKEMMAAERRTMKNIIKEVTV